MELKNYCDGTGRSTFSRDRGSRHSTATVPQTTDLEANRFDLLRFMGFCFHDIQIRMAKNLVEMSPQMSIQPMLEKLMNSISIVQSSDSRTWKVYFPIFLKVAIESPVFQIKSGTFQNESDSKSPDLLFRLSPEKNGNLTQLLQTVPLIFSTFHLSLQDPGIWGIFFIFGISKLWEVHLISSLEIIMYHIANLQTLIKSPKVSASCGRYGCIAWILTDFNRFLTIFSCRICSFWGRCSIFWGGGSRGLSELFGRPNVQLPRWRGHHHRSWITH